jgi:hypothetical protein
MWYFAAPDSGVSMAVAVLRLIAGVYRLEGRRVQMHPSGVSVPSQTNYEPAQKRVQNGA